MIQAFVTVGNLMFPGRERLYRTAVSEIRRRCAGSIIGSAWLRAGSSSGTFATTDSLREAPGRVVLETNIGVL
jgi:hypothetical protein